YYTVWRVYLHTLSTRRPAMAFVITLPCIGVKDTACVTICPMGCIHPKPGEAGFADAEMLYIDPEECIDCHLCVDECPAKAIFHEDDVPGEWREFVERNAAHYRR